MAAPVVSVVMAVYDMAPYLEQCLESIWAQTIGAEQLEVIAVDDGSTDGSLDLLDGWAATHPQLRVVRGPRTGAPGAPRNRGLDLSRGEFVFFADPDDHLGVEALERMVGAARRDGSEVVIGRMRGVGRRVPVRPFQRSVAAGDVVSTRAVWTLTAHKLFSRDLLVRHGLRFAEGARLAEEQPLVVPALFLADGISVVADYDCYYLVSHDGQDHLTGQVVDPATFLPIVRSSIETVVAHTVPGQDRDALMSRFVEVELARKFSARFTTLPEPTRSALLDGARGILDDLVPDRVDLLLPLAERLRIACVRRGSADHIGQLGAFEKEGAVEPPVVDGERVLARWPGLRDPGWGVPDPYYDVADALVPDLAEVRLEGDGHCGLEVRVRPATARGGAASTRWEVRLRRDGQEHRVPVVAGLARVDLAAVDPDPGRWAVVLAVWSADEPEEVQEHHVGRRGSRCEVQGELSGITVRRGPGGAVTLDVDSDLPTRPRLARSGLRWSRGRLEVSLPAPRARGGSVLVLRSGDRSVQVPLELADGVLRGSFVPGTALSPGRWALWVSSRHPVPEKTVRVGVEVDRRPWAWHPSAGRVARVHPAGEHHWARLELLGRRRWARRVAGSIVRPLRRRRGTTTA